MHLIGGILAFLPLDLVQSDTSTSEARLGWVFFGAEGQIKGR